MSERRWCRIENGLGGGLGGGAGGHERDGYRFSCRVASVSPVRGGVGMGVVAEPASREHARAAFSCSCSHSRFRSSHSGFRSRSRFHFRSPSRSHSQSRSRSRSRAWDGAVVVARARSNTMRSSRVVSSCCVHGETREDEKREDDVAAEGASAGRSGPDNCSPYSRTMRRPSPGRDAAAGGGDAADATAAGASTGDAQRGSASAAASRRAPPGISTVPWRRKTRYGRRATRDWRYWSGASGVGHRRVERPRALFCQKVTLITPA